MSPLYSPLVTSKLNTCLRVVSLSDCGLEGRISFVVVYPALLILALPASMLCFLFSVYFGVAAIRERRTALTWLIPSGLLLLLFTMVVISFWINPISFFGTV
jgi:hypothetical protein